MVLMVRTFDRAGGAFDASSCSILNYDIYISNCWILRIVFLMNEASISLEFRRGREYLSRPEDELFIINK